MLAREMENIFIKKGIPVVPSLGEFTSIYVSGMSFSVMFALAAGNNDIWRKCFTSKRCDSADLSILYSTCKLYVPPVHDSVLTQ